MEKKKQGMNYKANGSPLKEKEPRKCNKSLGQTFPRWLPEKGGIRQT